MRGQPAGHGELFYASYPSYSATDELLGLQGGSQISTEPDGGHTFALDYDFE